MSNPLVYPEMKRAQIGIMVNGFTLVHSDIAP
jgi:hypothetical protein